MSKFSELKRHKINKNTTSASCFIFLLDIAKITILMKKKTLKNATVGISREIWWSNRETGRFHEKLGESRQNRESWQVWPIVLFISFQLSLQSF